MSREPDQTTNSTEAPWVDLAADFEAFDVLPPSLRLAMAAAIVDFDSGQQLDIFEAEGLAVSMALLQLSEEDLQNDNPYTLPDVPPIRPWSRARPDRRTYIAQR